MGFDPSPTSNGLQDAQWHLPKLRRVATTSVPVLKLGPSNSMPSIVFSKSFLAARLSHRLLIHGLEVFQHEEGHFGAAEEGVEGKLFSGGSWDGGVTFVGLCGCPTGCRRWLGSPEGGIFQRKKWKTHGKPPCFWGFKAAGPSWPRWLFHLDLWDANVRALAIDSCTTCGAT